MKHLIKSALILLALTTTAMAQEVTPEDIATSRHSGIIASEVHPNPVIGPVTQEIATNSVKIAECPTGWTYTCVETECNCLP
jgi:hypothetical protein